MLVTVITGVIRNSPVVVGVKLGSGVGVSVAVGGIAVSVIVGMGVSVVVGGGAVCVNVGMGVSVFGGGWNGVSVRVGLN